MQIEQHIATYRVSESAERMTAAGGAAFIACGSILVTAFDPTKLGFLPVCPLYSMTGFACPGCGLTRGFHALFHGDVVTAMDFNALIPIWALMFAYVFVSLTLLAVRGKALPMWPTSPRFLWVFMILLMVFGVMRNIPAYPFTVLFP